MIYIAKCLNEDKEIYASKSKKKTLEFAEKHAGLTRHAVDVFEVNTNERGVINLKEIDLEKVRLDQFSKEQIKLIKRFKAQ